MATGRLLHRAVSSPDLDLYVLAAAALVCTVLGSTGVAEPEVLSSAILGLLTFLAVAQVRSRRQVAKLAEAHQRRPTDLLHSEFSEQLFERRANARRLLLIGLSLASTVEAGGQHLRAVLKAGGKVRILVADPYDEATVETIVRRSGDPEIRDSILHSLKILEQWRRSGVGDLEIRVLRSAPHIHVNAVDVGERDAIITVQFYEYRPEDGYGAIINLSTEDEPWFTHFVAEAERMWDDGEPWPPAPARTLAPARPPFLHRFDEGVFAVVDEARDLLVTGATRNTLLTSGYARFERLLRAGCRLRFLLIDPDADAMAIAAERYYVHRDANAARERVRYALKLLSELRRSTGGDLTVRLTHYPLSMGLIVVDPTGSGGVVLAEFYQYQAGAEPCFVLRESDDPWFGYFVDEAEAIWQAAGEYPLDAAVE
ncbi:hypothetical protein AB0C07_36675 [Actinoplanes missouriensis]|uniref:hypothetical protein n=1 Tax=Actinoplanes missouriensis TaxID=1866 RepID=UPI0033C19AAF